MRAAPMPTALTVVVALAAPALAHGGGYVPPPNGTPGPQAAPGFGDPSGPSTRWETWWAENRDGILRIAERLESVRRPVTTPCGDGLVSVDLANARARAARELAARVLPHLEKALSDEDYDVRASAAIAIGKIGDAANSGRLRDMARSDLRPDARHAALLGLGLLGSPKSLPFLADLLGDRKAESDERAFAALAIGLVGGDDAASFLASYASRAASRSDAGYATDVQLLATVYVGLGLTASLEAPRELWRAVDDDSVDPFLRAHAVLSLGRLADRESVERCVRLLTPGTDPQLRRSAVATLGRIAGKDDRAALHALVTIVTSDRDLLARRFAIGSLGRVRDVEVRGVLRTGFDAAQAADPERAFYALALALQADTRSASAIRTALRDVHDESLRAAYCTALGVLGEPDSVETLEAQFVPGPSPGLFRGYAALALAILPSPSSADVIWRRLPFERDARVRCDMAVALGLLGDRRAGGVLLADLREGDGNFARCRAAAGLGVLRSSEAVPELAQALANTQRNDGIVRALCAVALGQIADPSIVPKLARLAAGGDLTLATRALAEALTIL